MSCLCMFLLGFIGMHIYTMIHVNNESIFFTSRSGTASIIPAFLLYHSFSTGEAVMFSLLTFIVVIILTGSIIEKMLREDRLGNSTMLYI